MYGGTASNLNTEIHLFKVILKYEKLLLTLFIQRKALKCQNVRK